MEKKLTLSKKIQWFCSFLEDTQTPEHKYDSVIVASTEAYQFMMMFFSKVTKKEDPHFPIIYFYYKETTIAELNTTTGIIVVIPNLWKVVYSIKYSGFKENIKKIIKEKFELDITDIVTNNQKTVSNVFTKNEFENNKIAFDYIKDLFSKLDLVNHSEKYPDIRFYFKDNTLMASYHERTNTFYYNYNKIVSVISNHYNTSIEKYISFLATTKFAIKITQILPQSHSWINNHELESYYRIKKSEQFLDTILTKSKIKIHEYSKLYLEDKLIAEYETDERCIWCHNSILWKPVEEKFNCTISDFKDIMKRLIWKHHTTTVENVKIKEF